jgi:hypothetical protein
VALQVKKYAEALPKDENLHRVSVDVTEDADGETQAMNTLKGLYKTAYTYRFHICHHPEQRPCEVIDA